MSSLPCYLWWHRHSCSIWRALEGATASRCFHFYNGSTGDQKGLEEEALCRRRRFVGFRKLWWTSRKSNLKEGWTLFGRVKSQPNEKKLRNCTCGDALDNILSWNSNRVLWAYKKRVHKNVARFLPPSPLIHSPPIIFISDTLLSSQEADVDWMKS